MADVALSFDHVGKRYGRAGYRSLREELGAGRTPRRAPEQLALDDVSFEVQHGEAFAVIGPNGAGKSTALRLAARITAPSTGTIRIRGRVGALIEVGAGIHPELTGRENIWLYGAILGLSRREIAARFDDIVEFAELGAVLDRMVKHYSSGMQLRLGFSIAAGIRPDVLVVDEALAVGDARFQLRCLERMSELVRSGTTLVYVSHDLASVDTVCRRAALLIGGRVHHLGAASATIGAYVQWLQTGSAGDVRGVVRGAGGEACDVFHRGDSIVIDVPVPPGGRERTVALGIRDGHAWNLLGTSVVVPADHPGSTARCRIDAVPLHTGTYQVWAAVDGAQQGRGADGAEPSAAWRQIAVFRVSDADDGPLPPWRPPVAFAHQWELE